MPGRSTRPALSNPRARIAAKPECRVRCRQPGLAAAFLTVSASRRSRNGDLTVPGAVGGPGMRACGVALGSLDRTFSSATREKLGTKSRYRLPWLAERVGH